MKAVVKIQRHVRERNARHLMKAAHKAAGMHVQKLRATQANERRAKEEIDSLREQVDEAEELREITPRLQRQLKRMEQDHTAELNKMELDHRLAIEKVDRQHQADLENSRKNTQGSWTELRWMQKTGPERMTPVMMSKRVRRLNRRSKHGGSTGGTSQTEG